MSEPGNTLSVYLERKLAGRCTRCGEPAADDQSLCGPHLADQRKRTRAANAKRRLTRKRKRKCVDCGRKAKRRRCRGCYRKSRGEHKVKQGEHKREQIWRVDPGTEWNRYRGKGRRGRLTREEQIDEDIRDAAFAIGELRKFVEKAAYLKHPEVAGLPPIQREAARRAVGQYLGFSGRIVDDLSERYG